MWGDWHSPGDCLMANGKGFVRDPNPLLSPSDRWTPTFPLSNFVGVSQTLVRGPLLSKQTWLAGNYRPHLVQSLIFSQRSRGLEVSAFDWLAPHPVPAPFLWFVCQLFPPGLRTLSRLDGSLCSGVLSSLPFLPLLHSSKADSQWELPFLDHCLDLKQYFFTLANHKSLF